MAHEESSAGLSGNLFEDVKEKVTLEEYFGNYLKVDLRPESAGRLRGLCPYHDEKSPSFVVYTDDRSFMCYGCERNGTVIDAVMEKEGFSEPMDAVRWINDQYGLGLKQDSAAYAKFKERVDAAKGDAEKAEEKLWDAGSTLGQQGMKMLQRRGLNDEMIKYFELGVTESDGGRVTIPIRDKGNHIITIVPRAIFDIWECKECHHKNSSKDIFVARDNDGDPSKCLNCGKNTIPRFFVSQHPKYKNTIGYEKSRVLYNEPKAREHLLSKDEDKPLLIMEGYGDVWACTQANYASAVSYNGASISAQQAQQAIKLVERAIQITKKAHKYILLVPDFDTTGRAAIAKNIANIRKIDPMVEIKVLYGVDEYSYKTEGGETKTCKDLGELLQYHGAEIVERVLTDNRMSADEHRIREVLDYEHYTRETQIQEVARILGEVRHTIELDDLIPVIAQKWDRDEGQVQRFLHSNVAHTESSVGTGLLADIYETHAAAVEYLKDGFVIKSGFPTIDGCLPGGGFRLQQLSLWLGKSGVGKTNMMLNLIKNFAKYQDLPTIFFSLEQPKAQLYMRLVQMVLEVDTDEATEIIRNNDEEQLKKVDSIFENLIIVDGVPDTGGLRPEMTPATIARLVQEINLTRFQRPAAVVLLDHLSICKPPKDAPRSARDDENNLAGYLMEEFFAVSKDTNTFFIILQQLPKDVRPGKEFSYDAGRGGSRQTDFSDYIFCIWRPEQNEEIDDEERLAVQGQYKLKIGKNRHGMSKTAHCTFDWRNLKIEESEHLTPMPAAGAHPVESIVDSRALIDELIDETDDGSIGMDDMEAEGVPSWFDK